MPLSCMRASPPASLSLRATKEAHNYIAPVRTTGALNSGPFLAVTGVSIYATLNMASSTSDTDNLNDNDNDSTAYPPMNAAPDILTMPPEQALNYFNQSLSSLIQLREVLIKRKRLSPQSPFLDDKSEYDSWNSAAAEGEPCAHCHLPRRPDVPPNTQDLNQYPRRGSSNSVVSPLNANLECRCPQGAAAHHSGTSTAGRSNIGDPADMSPLIMQHPAGAVFGGGVRSVPGKELSREERLKKNSMLLTEAAEVAALVLEGSRASIFSDTTGRVVPVTPDEGLDGKLSTKPPSPNDHFVNDTVDRDATVDEDDDGTNTLIEEQRYAIARRFWSKTVPEIPVKKYLERLHKYCPTSTAVYLAAGVYIYRLCIVLQMIPLTELSVHRLVLASIRVAAKALEDAVHPQARFATAAGVSISDLYRLEVALLFILDFNIKVDHEVLQAALITWSEVQVQAKTLGTEMMPHTPESVPENEG